jgi:hypothetical protein
MEQVFRRQEISWELGGISDLWRNNELYGIHYKSRSSYAVPARRRGLPKYTSITHTLELELELEFLRLTVSQPVRLGIRPPFGTLDQMLFSSSFSSDNYFILRSKASSLTRKRVCSSQCNHSLVRLLMSNNHTLPSHLRLCSLVVASYDSRGLRWKYSNPPPHGLHILCESRRFIIWMSTTVLRSQQYLSVLY